MKKEIKFKCNGCGADPCTLVVLEEYGIPSECVYGLTDEECRWDEEDKNEKG